MPRPGFAEMMRSRSLPLAQSPGGVKFFSQQKTLANTALYDTIRHDLTAALPARLDFFRVPFGQAGNGFVVPKGYSETNNRAQGQLGRPHALLVNQVIVSLIPEGDAAATATPWQTAFTDFVASVLEDATLRISVDDDEWYLDHLISIPGTGLTGLPDIVGAGPTHHLSGAPFPSASPVLLQPIPIPSRRRLRVSIETNPNQVRSADTFAAQFVYLRVYMQGNYSDTVR